MKKTKAILALLLALSMLFGSVPVSAAGSATFEVQTVTAEAGESVDVAISVKNSPGITSTKLSVAFDDALTLTNVTYGTEITGNFVKPKNMASPVILNWANGLEDFSGDYVFATLTFQVSAEADIGFCPITVTYDPDDVYNVEETNADFAITNGGIQVECSHASKTEVPSKSASCTASGNNLYYTCDFCSMAFKADGITQTTVDAETIPATGHGYNDADCTTPRTCDTCGATDGNALGHSYTNYISNNDATCTADGTKTAKCDRCTETDTVTDVGSAKGHDYADATCTAPKTCKICTATEGASLDHSYTNYVSNNDATCTADGTKTAKCDRCTETDTVADIGSAKGHDYADATCTAPKTCKVCNTTEGAALGHNFNTAWSKGEDGHWHECGTCGDKIDQAVHNFGSAGDTCLTCAYKRAHVHRLSLVPAQSANCTDSGNKAYYTCSGCEDWFEDASGAVLIADKTSVVLAALGHDYADATCTTSKTCKVCDTTEGAALGHSYSTVWSKGEEGHWHECSACGDKIDLVEHDFGTEGDKCTICEYERSHVHRLTPVSGVDATCTENGSKAYYTCSGCEDWFEDALGTVLIADKSAVVAPAQGHDFAAATCTTVKTCKSCGATEGALLDHSDTNSDGKCDMCEKTMTPTAQPDPNNPQTGDDSDVFVWLMLMLVSIGAIAVCLIGSKKRLFR